VRALLDAGQEQFPDTAADHFTHGIDPAIPTVEIADHADSFCVRRPYREINAGSIADGARMRAELFINLPVLSFSEEVQIDFAHDRPVLIGIAGQVMRSVPGSDSQMVWKIPCCVSDSRAEKTVLLNFLRCDRLLGMLINYDLDLARIGTKNTDFQVVSNPMRTQHSKGIGMRAADKAAHFIRWQPSNIEWFHSYSWRH